MKEDAPSMPVGGLLRKGAAKTSANKAGHDRWKETRTKEQIEKHEKIASKTQSNMHPMAFCWRDVN